MKQTQKQPHVSEMWQGIDKKSLPQLRAKRWTKKTLPKDIPFEEAQARQWYAPLVVRDTITTVQGHYEAKINRTKKLDVVVRSNLYWIQPRKMVAIRVWWASREVAVGRAFYSMMETYSYTPITEFEHTWFFERYMSDGKYYLDERAYKGAQLLERLRTMAALRFD